MKTYESFLESLTGTLARFYVAIAITGLLLLGAAMMPRPASAQSANPGLPRPELVKLLKDSYAEVPTAVGLDREGWLVEVFTSGDGATWTMVRTKPNGKSFVVTTGESWTQVIPVRGEMSSAYSHRSLGCSRGKAAEQRSDPLAMFGELDLVGIALC